MRNYLNNFDLSNLVTIFLSLFVISLPFNGIEWDVFGINRFEIKITMVTFVLLFAVWMLVIQKNGIKYKNNEIFIYLLMFIYICTQYFSIINSRYSVESLRQSIIITSFAIMMIVSSQLVTRRKIAHYVIICMGFSCVTFSTILLIIHYNYSYSQRLGQLGSCVQECPIYFSWLRDVFRGDPAYFGDIIIFGLGPLYYTIFYFCRNNLYLVLSIPFLLIVFLAISSTNTKGVVLALLIFFIISILLLKGWRKFMMLGCMLFLIAISIEISFKHLYPMVYPGTLSTRAEGGQYLYRLLSPTHINQVTVIPSYCCPGRPSQVPTLKSDISINNKQSFNSFSQGIPEELVEEELREVERVNVARLLENIFNDRIFITSAFGRSSYDGRLKAIKVSLINSFSNFWLGNGAGTSPKLLPKMISDYDKSAARINLKKAGMDRIPELLLYNYISDGIKWNVSLIDSHNLFLTEFFNIGIIGASALLILVCQILYRQYRAIITNNNKNNLMNELLFATLIAMLVHRMTGSFVAIPFLWFILGLSLGVSKLQFSPHQS